MTAAPTLDAPGGAATLAALGSAPDELGQVLALLRAAGVERPEQPRRSASATDGCWSSTGL